MKRNAQRHDFELMARWVPEGAHVLDLGCGDGELLEFLQKNRHIDAGYGVEIDERKVLRCLQRGVNVLHADLESELSIFEANSFDVVILSQTLQSMKNTEHLIQEMLRIGREVIVSFPNFGYWSHRFQILLGRMPVSHKLPYAWHNTPNIHLCTIKDFDIFCEERNIHIIERRAFCSNQPQYFLENMFATLAVYRLCSGDRKISV
jgi:methionine biosynthesis protein MetW